jgi:hypothetical protein
MTANDLVLVREIHLDNVKAHKLDAIGMRGNAASDGSATVMMPAAMISCGEIVIGIALQKRMTTEDGGMMESETSAFLSGETKITVVSGRMTSLGVTAMTDEVRSAVSVSDDWVVASPTRVTGMTRKIKRRNPPGWRRTCLHLAAVVAFSEAKGLEMKSTAYRRSRKT